jgi:GDP-L-fucose synthase
VSFWTDQNVLVTGGGGFLGSFVVEKLKEAGCKNISAPRRSDFDLSKTDNVVRLYEKTGPDLVIHLAAVVGGIGANRKHPGQFFYQSAIMGIQMIEYARRFGVKKFVCIGTVCSYPKFTPVPFKEEDLWNGYPEETNAPYGLAKKMLMVQLQAYREEYGFNGITLIPVNLYGPGDSIDVEDSHVIPALIRKCLEAKRQGQPKITAWGTGRATREFLFVRDAADAIVHAAEKYNKPEPVNLGSGQEISIRELLYKIKELTGYQGEVEWDVSKPDGQPRRCLDTSKAWKEFGWRSQTGFNEGIRQTVDWVVANYDRLITKKDKR